MTSVTTKSETIRAEFSGNDFLVFNDLNSRLVFKGRELSSRKEREESVKFAVKFTALAVKSIINTDGSNLFVEDNENTLMTQLEFKFNAPIAARNAAVDTLLRSLTKINSKSDLEEENITISSKEWSEIMSQVISLRE